MPPEPPRSLAAIQAFLGDAFRRSEAFGEEADLAPTIRTVVSGNERLTPVEQAEIYREQFWLRHRDVLRDDFPALRHLLGEEAFDALARAYLEACPPDSFTLRNLGQRLADFVATYEAFSPELAGPARDMARFELAFVDIFDGPDVEPIDGEAVQAIPAEAWPTARLTLQPFLTVLELSYPVQRYRTEVRQERVQPEAPNAAAEESDEGPSAAKVPIPEAEPTWVVLWRGEDLRVHYRPVPAPEAALVARIQRGLPLGQACADVAETLSDTQQQAFPGRLGQWFQGWAKRGWIVAIDV